MNPRSEVRLAQARWAVEVWAEFPVGRARRPLVLVGDEVETSGAFRTRAAHDAIDAGQIDWQTTVPAAVQRALQRHGTRLLAPSSKRKVAVTDAGQGEFPFQTDRGSIPLPAWWLQGPQINGRAWVLEPSIDRWAPAPGSGGTRPLPPTQMPPLYSPIEIDPTGKEITFSWAGEWPPGETISAVESIETDHAVSLAVIMERKPAEPGMGYTLQGTSRRITSWLARPLGSRVFVGLHGEPLEVIPAGTASQTPRPTLASFIPLLNGRPRDALTFNSET